MTMARTTERGEGPHRAGWLPIMCMGHGHSVLFKFLLRSRSSQAESKPGEMYIVAHKAGKTYDAMNEDRVPDSGDDSFDGGRVIFEWPLIANDDVTVVLWFPLRRMKGFSIWYKQGTGSLSRITGGTLQPVFCDDHEGNWRKCYHVLCVDQSIHTNDPSVGGFFFFNFFAAFIDKAIKKLEAHASFGEDVWAFVDELERRRLPTSLAGLKVIRILLQQVSAFTTFKQSSAGRPREDWDIVFARVVRERMAALEFPTP